MGLLPAIFGTTTSEVSRLPASVVLIDAESQCFPHKPAKPSLTRSWLDASALPHTVRMARIWCNMKHLLYDTNLILARAFATSAFAFRCGGQVGVIKMSTLRPPQRIGGL